MIKDERRLCLTDTLVIDGNFFQVLKHLHTTYLFKYEFPQAVGSLDISVQLRVVMLTRLMVGEKVSQPVLLTHKRITLLTSQHIVKTSQ